MTKQTFQEKEVEEIADLLSVPASTSASLLRHFHWKRERFLTRYLENPQQVCQSAGVPYIFFIFIYLKYYYYFLLLLLFFDNKEHIPNSGAKLRSLSSSKNVGGSSSVPSFCSICGDDELDSSNSSALSCNHTFCNECWGMFYLYLLFYHYFCSAGLLIQLFFRNSFSYKD